MKTTTIKTTLLSLIIFSITFSAKAQKEYRIGLTDTANIALFLVDFHNYELIKADFVNLPCTACENSGLMYFHTITDGATGVDVNYIFHRYADLGLASYKTSSSINYGLVDGNFRLFPNLSHPINEEAFKYRTDSTRYYSLPNNLIIDLDRSSPQSLVQESEVRKKQRLDSAWALISSSRIARKFIKMSNYHLTFKYIRYDQNPTNIAREKPAYERWFVLLQWTDGPVSINKAQENPLAQVFPNPTSQFTKVEVKGLNPNETTVLKLFNLNGKLITSQSFKTNEVSTQFDLANLPNGIYSLHIQNSNSYKISKIIKI